ncbi:hypothetical protein [uncultured Tistrella sp.]|uniref:hypothetical protein n=1 Tax=Tistrella mobilis TaxID=171437 RepID=UPI000C0A1A04|nr:hypothetical protein [uncultured Tistrella sp.]MAM75638.1 hypothetical protein [Tistrella sp.]
MSTRRLQMLRDRMTGLIAAWLPEATVCRSHPGAVDAAVAAALIGAEPAGTEALVTVIVTGLGPGRMMDDGRHLHAAALAAWIATRHDDAGDRDRAALDLVEAVASRLPLAAPLAHPAGAAEDDEPAPGAPHDVTAGLYTPPAADPAICLWRIDWLQEVVLGEAPAELIYPLPTEILAGFAPRIGPDHVADYVLVNGLDDPDAGGGQP